MIPPCRSFQHRLHLLGLISNYLTRISWIGNDLSMSNSLHKERHMCLNRGIIGVFSKFNLCAIWLTRSPLRRVLAHRLTSTPLFVLRKEILICGSLQSLLFPLPSHHLSSSLYSPADLTR
jgi:hypothetical protein